MLGIVVEMKREKKVSKSKDQRGRKYEELVKYAARLWGGEGVRVQSAPNWKFGKRN